MGAGISLLPRSSFSAFYVPFGKFSSPLIQSKINTLCSSVADPSLSLLIQRCLPNTLDTTVSYSLKDGRPDTYVITGDIHAMWLRDSAAQVNPYLPWCKEDPHLRSMILGLVHRHLDCIRLDPYANAFYKDSAKISPWKKSDNTLMKPGVHERKWELDSLCYSLRLIRRYYEITGDRSLLDRKWLDTMSLILKTMREQQRKNGQGPYRFLRTTDAATDNLPGSGYGNPVKPCGMIASAFRNSDDAAIYLFNIPANAFAVVELTLLASILADTGLSKELALEAAALSDEVLNGIRTQGIAEHPQAGRIYAYETDGFGNHLFMDDAGVPSLIALPYLGFMDHPSLYEKTRAFALSPMNPYFFKGNVLEGTGSPHLAWTGKEMVWPIGIAMRGLTASDAAEAEHCLRLLMKCHGGKFFMHEGVNKDDPSDFTRSWFAWANSLFGEFVLHLEKQWPELLKKTYEK